MGMVHPAGTGNYGLTKAPHSKVVAPYYPLWFAGWYNSSILGSTRYLWELGNSADNTTFLSVRITSGGVIHLTTSSGGTATTVNSGSAVTVGTWTFIFAQNVSLTNHLIETMNFGANGYKGVADTAIATAITALDRLTIGSRYGSTVSGMANGCIAEFYYGIGDPFGGQLMGAPLMTDLAQRGPFVYSNLRASMLEYRSLRTHLRSLDPDTDFYRGPGNPTFDRLGPIMGFHPPFSPLYERPRARRRAIVY